MLLPTGDPGDLVSNILASGNWPPSLPPDAVSAVWADARRHSVDVLLAARLRPLEARLDSEMRLTVAETWYAAIAEDLVRHRELAVLTRRFHGAGIDLLLLKGAGLAYTIYPQSHLRPSRDVDLFVSRHDVDAAARTLAECGYARSPEPDFELASTQRHYTKADGPDGPSFVDLHWRVVSPLVFADVLPFADAWHRSIAAPALGPDARTLCRVDALVHACVHRVAHHQDTIDLLWIWDIHLLAAAMAPGEWAALVAHASGASVRAVCARGLRLTHQRFRTPIPPTVLEQLDASVEESASMFLGGWRVVDVVGADLRVAAWPDRLRLLREHLFPSLEYMRAKYTRWPRALLSLAYVDRVLRGAPRWFRRS